MSLFSSSLKSIHSDLRQTFKIGIELKHVYTFIKSWNNYSCQERLKIRVSYLTRRLRLVSVRPNAY